MQPEGSLPIHKYPLPVPTLSQLDPIHTPTSHSLKIHFNITLPSTPGSLKWSLSLRFPHQNPAYASPLPVRAICPSIPISILSPEQYLVCSRDHQSTHYAVFSTPLLHHPSYHSLVTSSLLEQIFYSSPYSQIATAYVPPSMWATKFHTHTKQVAELYKIKLSVVHFEFEIRYVT